MTLFALIIGIILIGMLADAAVSKNRDGKIRLSRGWYLILGLGLILPSMGAPFALLHELQNPNLNVQTFSLPLTICFLLGVYLIIRFFSTKHPTGEQVPSGNPR